MPELIKITIGASNMEVIPEESQRAKGALQSSIDKETAWKKRREEYTMKYNKQMALAIKLANDITNE